MHTTAEFALTRVDFTRFQRLAGRRLLARRDVQAINVVAKFVLWLLVAMSLFIAFRAAARHPEDASALYAMAALVGVALVLARMMPHLVGARVRHRLVVDDGAFLRSHAITFTDAGFTVTWRSGRSEHAWSDVLCRAADATHHYLFIDGCAAVIVPRHAVGPFQADFDRMVAAIPGA